MMSMLNVRHSLIAPRGAPRMATSATEKSADLFRRGADQYLLEERDALLGDTDSCVLLESDNANGLLPLGVERDANAVQLTFVDEYTCIGCRNCAEVARATFR